MLYVYLERHENQIQIYHSTGFIFTIFLAQNILFSVYFVYNLPETIINAILPLIFLGLEFAALTLLLMITRE